MFHEIRFPDDISYGSSGGPSFKTEIISTDGGGERRVSRWSEARRRYDVSYGVKSSSQAEALHLFYLARMGSLVGFRFKDFLDCTSLGRATEMDGATPTEDDQQIGVGDGATVAFQLTKTYSDAGASRVRNITKPVSGSVLIAKDGVNQTSGWTVNTATGVVTFTTAPANGVVITAGYEFDVPVRFDGDEVLSLRIEDWDNWEASILLIEVLNESTSQDEFFFGGAKELSMAANATLSAMDGRVVVVNATTGSLSLTLPDPASLQPGGPYFYVFAITGSSTFALKNHLGTTLISIGANQGAEVVLTKDSGGAKVWYAI